MSSTRATRANPTALAKEGTSARPRLRARIVLLVMPRPPTGVRPRLDSVRRGREMLVVTPAGMLDAILAAILAAMPDVMQDAMPRAMPPVMLVVTLAATLADPLIGADRR